MLLIAAFVYGGIIRFAAPAAAHGPVNDGGLFLQMTADLVENKFFLPAFTSYNQIDIPFAYPPLMFYFAGALHAMFKLPLFDLFTWLPPFFSLLTVLAFYFLACELTQNELAASIASLFYACAPRAFDWFVMGGGVTRAPGMLFAFLLLAFARRLFVTRDGLYIWHVSLLAALLILTHPEAAYHAALTAILFAVFYLRGWRSFLQAAASGFLAALLTAPWWALILRRHGIDPFLSATGAHPPDIFWAVLIRVQFNMAGEILLTLIAVLALIGLITQIHAREFFLPAWVMFGGRYMSMAAFSLLAAKGLEVVFKGLGEARPFEQGLSLKVSKYAVLGLSGYLLMGGMLASSRYGLEFRLLPGDREAMAWAAGQGASARFLVVTGGDSLSDPLSEWFPALTGKVSLATVQGREWTPSQDLLASVARYDQLQSCLSQTRECLAGWDFDYVYLRRVSTAPDGRIMPLASILEYDIRLSDEYQIVFENNEAVIFQPVR